MGVQSRLALGIVGLVVGAAVLAGCASGRPGWDAQASRIAYAHHGQVYVIDAATRAVRRVTSGPSIGGDSEISTSWSPDGGSIAFVRTTTSLGGSEVWVVELATGVERRVTGGRFPSWSPDGTRLAILRYTSGGDPDGDRVRASLHLVDLATGEVRDTGTTTRAVTPAWSPDSGRIAVARPVDGILIVDPAGHIEPALLAPGAPYVELVGWSPDGTQLVISRQTAPGGSFFSSGRWDLALLPAEGGALADVELVPDVAPPAGLGPPWLVARYPVVTWVIDPSARAAYEWQNFDTIVADVVSEKSGSPTVRVPAGMFDASSTLQFAAVAPPPVGHVYRIDSEVGPGGELVTLPDVGLWPNGTARLYAIWPTGGVAPAPLDGVYVSAAPAFLAWVFGWGIAAIVIWRVARRGRNVPGILVVAGGLLLASPVLSPVVAVAALALLSGGMLAGASTQLAAGRRGLRIAIRLAGVIGILNVVPGALWTEAWVGLFWLFLVAIALAGAACLRGDLRRLGVVLLAGALSPVLDALLVDPFASWRLGTIAFGLAMVWLGVAVAGGPKRLRAVLRDARTRLALGSEG